MIKKLQKKFVLINMLLVTTVLLIVFTAFYISNYTKQLSSLDMALEHELALHNMDIPEPRKFEIGQPKRENMPQDMFIPLSFCVSLDSNHQVTQVRGENVEVSDEVLATAIATVLASPTLNSGTISSLNLRYAMNTVSDGTQIAFIDTTNFNQTMTTILVTSLCIGCAGLLAFFAISIFLAKWSIKPVEQAWEQQRQFIADASHELKTPLTVILANTDILQAHPNDTIAVQHKWIEYINDEATRMKKLVEDMLFLAKSDAAKLPNLQSELNLSDLVWSCCLPFESVAFEQGLTLNTEVAPNVQITGDEGQLKQLVRILLDNACKYADEHGAVTVTLSYTQEKAHLSVNNTGSYISEEEMKHLFERFYRVDESRARKAGGYGLGLAIAHSIVTNHHGHIVVKSNEMIGTTFEILL